VPSSRDSRGGHDADLWSGERLDPDARAALRLRVVAQDDGDELLRLLNPAVLAKADRPLDAEELAERVAAMIGVRPVPERGH
jgi:hypothetical protein